MHLQGQPFKIKFGYVQGQDEAVKSCTVKKSFEKNLFSNFTFNHFLYSYFLKYF